MISRHLPALFLASLLTVACSDEGSSSQAAGGSAGASAGSSGQGGAAGQGGAGAAGASAGQAGAAGASAGQAGAAGQAAGSSGSSGQGPDGFVFEPSEELTRLLAEMGKLRAGQPADLDGDGTAEATRAVDADGGVTLTVDPDGDGDVDFVLQTDGKGKLAQAVDSDSDGQIELEITTETTAEAETRVRSDDTDLDGQVNRRQTWVTAFASRTEQVYTEQVDTDGDGDVDQTHTETLEKAKNAGCSGADGFPKGGSDVPLFGDTISVVTGSGAGECGGADASSIARAVDCAMSRGTVCLASTNTNLYNSLMAAGMGDTKAPIHIGCGHACPGGIANTDDWSKWAIFDSRMNINPSEWNQLDAQGQCNIMLHELLHWAGDPGSADHNLKEGPGSDEVYSCGRYCGGCSDAGHGSPKNSAVDCARCADTPARKQQCGVQKKYVELPCGGALAGICHQGLACIAADCETCGGYELKDCDGNSLGGEATCCASCPGSCNGSNDMPCNGSKAEEDSCVASTPPFCKK